MKPRQDSTKPAPRRKRGFERTSGLLAQRIRKASESRGFSETRLLTHWAEIVGAEFSEVSRPVSVSYTKGGFGATLTVLTTGAQGPMLQMQEPRLREKINAVYGYNAIARIRFTQTSPTGFADGQAEFRPVAKPAPKQPDAACFEQAADLAADVADDGLRRALEALGADVFQKSKKT
ncbi:DUF721 domain-containing protein [Aliiruegeria sabulilitoris]|uniref:DUF721 domain-containing protein n=1 Tax=Aliiruegeria sabulilitoris TaxID=1510458 RepID=UPI0008316842|nr:DUF721 domain-containing protein [Aliiruegeria sabulilitoris]NDR58566.1 DUF721 domain-containing protein [Pseudoruegeria sp. M32A2M]